MKRFWIMWLAVAVALVIALPAGAGRPTNPGKPSPDEPDVIAGFTCAADPYTHVMFADDDFVIELGGRDTDLPSSACVDVMTVEAGRWEITVAGGGGRSLSLVPRDSHGPGDSCGGASLRGEEIYVDFTLPLVEDTRFDAIPAATVNACGADEFAEWIDEIYPNEDTSLWDADAICNAAFGGDYEVPCAVSERLAGHPHPLVLQASFQGSKDAIATISVDLPPYKDEEGGS